MNVTLKSALLLSTTVLSDGTDIIPLSPTLAAQCGYSMDSDPWGNTKVFVSLLGCYVDNQVNLKGTLKFTNDNLRGFLDLVSVLTP